MLNRKGPFGRGPRTGRRGICPSVGFGQEAPAPSSPVIQTDRSPTSGELAVWAQAEKAKERSILKAYLVRLQYSNLVKTAKFAAKYQIDLGEPELASLETRMQIVLADIEALRQNHCDVNGMILGVSPSAAGNDLDIVQPSQMALGLVWIPIAIGAVIVAGIIARWAYLETEVQTISDKYNGVLMRADQKLCADPTSPMCADWKATKYSGGYSKNVTLIDSVKNAVSTVGSIASKGIGLGLMLAIPVLMMLYLPRPRTAKET